MVKKKKVATHPSSENAILRSLLRAALGMLRSSEHEGQTHKRLLRRYTHAVYAMALICVGLLGWKMGFDDGDKRGYEKAKAEYLEKVIKDFSRPSRFLPKAGRHGSEF